MKFPLALACLTVLTSVTANAINGAEHNVRSALQPGSDEHDLFKRRGGGGGGGRGGGGSSGGGNSGGGGRSGSGNSGGTGSSSPSRNTGGTTPGGSGTRPSYGGGRYYGGGAVVPYPAGQRSRGKGLAPLLLLPAALAFWPGVWLYGAYIYDYDDTYTFHNATTDEDETVDVKCGCAQYAVCGCDENDDDDYLDDLVGDGSYGALDKSVINVAQVNGRQTLLINGTLPNGTTADADSPATSLRTSTEVFGLWPVIAAAVVTAVFMT